MSCYKIIYSKNGKRVGTEVFDDYDSALDSALTKSRNDGYLCVVLAFNFKTAKWFKRCTVYPNVR